MRTLTSELLVLAAESLVAVLQVTAEGLQAGQVGLHAAVLAVQVAVLGGERVDAALHLLDERLGRLQTSHQLAVGGVRLADEQADG